MSRITFVVNTTGLTGGIRVVFEYANRLQARGHTVQILYAYDLTGKDWPAREGWVALLKWIKFTFVRKVSWFKVQVPIIRVPRIIGRYLPDAEVVIATASETAEWVAALPPSKGEKFYLIQGWEDWSRGSAAVEATWRLPLRKVVIASWLVEKAHSLGEEVAAVITNGVNLEEFYCREKQFHQPPKVLLMTHTLPLKGTADGIAALQLLQKARKRFEITLFGAHPYHGPVPDGARFVHNPRGEALRQLYCSHDLFLSPSWQEGCQLPPMEAMACGCAVVATNVGGIPDYAVAGKTALVVEPKQPEELAKAIGRLLDDPELLQRLAAAGQQHIAGFTWERATDRLEKVIISHAH